MVAINHIDTCCGSHGCTGGHRGPPLRNALMLKMLITQIGENVWNK